MHRGRYQHALAVFARQLEYRVPHMLPRRVVKQEVISPPGRDGHGVRRVGHIVQRVGVYACRIDDAARFQRAVVGLDGPPGSAAVQRVQACNFGVKPKLHTVLAAFSANANVRPNGQTMPPVGAHSAATAASEMFGSISTSSSRSMMRSPSTPLAMPFHRAFAARGGPRRSGRRQGCRTGRRQNPAPSQGQASGGCPRR